MQFAIGDDRVALTVPDRQALLSIVETRLAARQGFALATMNVDHLEKLRSDADFRTAYAQHDLIVADGNPVVWLARLGGQRVSLVPGSDLVQPLCALAARLDRGVAILAGTEEGGQDAARRLIAAHPGLTVSLVAAPGFPFDPHGAEAACLRYRDSELRTGDSAAHSCLNERKTNAELCEEVAHWFSIRVDHTIAGPARKEQAHPTVGSLSHGGDIRCGT